MCSKEAKLVIIYPETTRHLGLFKDIENDDRVSLNCTILKKCNSFFKKAIRKIYFRTNFSKDIWYEYNDIKKYVNKIDRILIIDGALNVISLKFLEWCKRKNPNLIIDLYFINSLEAGSKAIINAKNMYNKFEWNHIYTFDPVDAEKYKFEFLGFNYYSKLNIENLKKDITSDVYFVGGLKGGREKEIIDLYNSLIAENVNCDFNINLNSEDNKPEVEGIKFNYGWISYSEILKHVLSSNCIIEILQKGQNGTTLRYFEAVCYNKKLLTNNPNIVNYPFYNSETMKYFKNIDDIDFEWIKERNKIEYNYKNEFSPVKLVNYLLENND